jgi:hypothetical protein
MAGDVKIWSYSVGRFVWSHSGGRLVNNRDWWRVSDVLTVTCIINVYFLLFCFIIFINCLINC